MTKHRTTIERLRESAAAADASCLSIQLTDLRALLAVAEAAKALRDCFGQTKFDRDGASHGVILLSPSADFRTALSQADDALAGLEGGEA